ANVARIGHGNVNSAGLPMNTISGNISVSAGGSITMNTIFEMTGVGTPISVIGHFVNPAGSIPATGMTGDISVAAAANLLMQTQPGAVDFVFIGHSATTFPAI